MDPFLNQINWSLRMDILAAFAHPDDETRFVGGTLSMLASKGVRVHLLIATRGEGGEVGEPPLSSQENLGEMRENEMQCAANALGAAFLSFLDYVDPRVTDNGDLFPFQADFNTLVSQLETHARKRAATTFISHGSNGEYGHPAHRLMHQAVVAAARKFDHIDVYTISAFYEGHPRPRLANNDDMADFLLSIRPWYAAKLRATECHRTQHALFVRRASQEAGRSLTLAEVTYDQESLHHAWPRDQSNHEDPLAHFLRVQCSEALIKK
jgi:LmbE family N-acetylglucosaminyl deacetylase